MVSSYESMEDRVGEEVVESLEFIMGKGLASSTGPPPEVILIFNDKILIFYKDQNINSLTFTVEGLTSH